MGLASTQGTSGIKVAIGIFKRDRFRGLRLEELMSCNKFLAAIRIARQNRGTSQGLADLR